MAFAPAQSVPAASATQLPTHRRRHRAPAASPAVAACLTSGTPRSALAVRHRGRCSRGPGAVSAGVCAAAGGGGHAALPPRPPRPKYVPGVISDPHYVRIFDTTLRDGEQSPGATLTSKEKLDIARQLAKLGVDIIEAGFPNASPDDLAAVRGIAQEVGTAVDEEGYVPVICGLSRAVKGDIDAAWEGVRHALRPRIHTFIATSAIHMEHKLRKTPDQVVAQAVEAVTYARSLGCDDVEFSPEDAGRSDPEFLYRILNAVVDAGATTINIPDTTGWNLPHEFGGLIAGIKANVKTEGRCVISTHCQNDLGLSTANSLAGVGAGARQVECTINGIGERAGNASLEEVAMAMLLRGQAHLGGAWHALHPVHIAVTSRMVADYTGMAVQPHKAIVGANAFAHESGIHQDGMLKNATTYEIMAPETIGLFRATGDVGVVLGKHSGRNALKTKLAALGYGDLEAAQLDDVFRRFKKVAETRGGGFADEDLLALVADEVHQPEALWALEEMQVVCGTMGLPTATVKMRGPDGGLRVTSAVGTGPVDAAYKAVDAIVGVPAQLVEYSVNAVTAGIDALATTRVQISAAPPAAAAAAGADGGSVNAQTGAVTAKTFSGSGTDEDIVCSSTRAYISALNKMLGCVMGCCASLGAACCFGCSSQPSCAVLRRATTAGPCDLRCVRLCQRVASRHGGRGTHAGGARTRAVPRRIGAPDSFFRPFSHRSTKTAAAAAAPPVVSTPARAPAASGKGKKRGD